MHEVEIVGRSAAASEATYARGRGRVGGAVIVLRVEGVVLLLRADIEAVAVSGVTSRPCMAGLEMPGSFHGGSGLLVIVTMG